MKIQPFILSLALAVPLTMVGQAMPSHNDNTYNNSNSKPSSKMTAVDHHFLHQLAQEDQSEIDLATLALKKSDNPQVKDYANSKILAARFGNLGSFFDSPQAAPHC
jgi:predicted outer membrane protein